MSKPLNLAMHWTPRILGILEAAFISIFALDVFEHETVLWRILVALGIHLIPTALLVAALIIAWRWALTGGLVYIALALAYAVSVPAHVDWPGRAMIMLPLFVIGVLFIVDWARQHGPWTSGGGLRTQ